MCARIPITFYRQIKHALDIIYDLCSLRGTRGRKTVGHLQYGYIKRYFLFIIIELNLIVNTYYNFVIDPISINLPP